MTGESVQAVWVAVLVLVAVALPAVETVARRRERRTRGRLAVLLAAESVARRRRSGTGARLRRWVPVAAVPVACLVLVGGWGGWTLGCLAAYGMWRWSRDRRPDAREEAAEVARGLPLAADLLAACAAAGAGPREAAEAVGESLGGPVGDRLSGTAAELRLGGEPSEVWGRFGRIPGAAGLARCLERAGVTGAPAAEPVARLAEGLRAERARNAVARAQRAQVLITAPVGLCFLPAFLVVGVVPVVIGLASGLLGAD